MNADGRRERSDKPLLGAVLCCTSVSPEQRTQYAEYAVQMGAEHKLDLTSDVTHLLVGDTNTPKYQYVAREREDVKVLRPEWVEAVRECWMNDERVDLNELDATYALPTFAGLKICITGFDEMVFRAQLQQAVSENGGEYTGDLTKDVTHLIAASCEGKKFQYATQWEKKIVSLKWLKDSLARKMQLDEASYHPSRPVDEQGRGAWNRRSKDALRAGKRPRPEPAAPEPARKLRRTASMKLGSQSEGLWGDIVSGGGSEPDHGGKAPLRSSKSLPVIRNQKQVADSFAGGENPEHEGDLAKSRRGLFAGKNFCVMGFDTRKMKLLIEAISNDAGTVYDSLEGLLSPRPLARDDNFIVVPHSYSKSHLARSYDLQTLPTLVTELWVEICLDRKSFTAPDQYPPGGLLAHNPVNGFESLIVNATGFTGVEVLHVSKMIKILGGTYEEVFKHSTSVLICKNDGPGKQKQEHAEEWRVPVVSVAWLWSCIKTCQRRPFDDYRVKTSVSHRNQAKTSARQLPGETETKTLKSKDGGPQNRHHTLQRKDSAGSAKELLNASRHRELLERQNLGSDFLEDENARPAAGSTPTARSIHVDTSGVQEFDQAQGVSRAKATSLKEISNNSPPKSRSASPPKRHMPKTANGNASISETEQEEQRHSPASVDLESLVPTEVVPNAQSINGAIQDLLSMKARAKSNNSSATEVSGKKKKLLGRALSNMSNSSMGSNVRASRASSVDTMNTDGVGSEIAAEISPGNGSRGGFTGRAKPRDAHASMELGGPSLHREEFYAPEEVDCVPQQTQLGYEDPEEAVLLREKLAARRKEQARDGPGDGQGDGEPNQEKAGKSGGGQRRIKDDDVLVGGALGGWGAGRRTRQKDRSPQGLKDF